MSKQEETDNKKMIQHYSVSTTDDHGHHIKRWWKEISLITEKKQDKGDAK